MTRLILACLLLTLTALPALAQQTTDDPIDTFMYDAGALISQPLRWQQPQWWTVAGVGLGAVVIYQYDDTIHSSLNRRKGTIGKALAELANPLGDWRAVFPALGATAWYAHRHQNPYLQSTAGQATEAAIMSYLATGLIKSATGRARPDSGLGAHEFDGPGIQGGGRMSFPSGHTAAAFAMASVIADRHPQTRVVLAAYGAATATGYARMAKNRHWASDVWTGAALGLWIGHSLNKRHSPNAPSVAVVPTESGMNLVLSWNR